MENKRISGSHSVRWKGTLASLRGKPVRLEFALREAQLYSFELVKQPVPGERWKLLK